MKKIICLIIVGLLLTVPTGLVWPGSPAFTVTVSTPGVTGTVITAIRVNASDNKWDEIPTSSLNFGLLTFDDKDQIFRAAYYYAIDVGDSAGGASTDVTVSYREGNTLGLAQGLGDRASLRIRKMIKTGPTTSREEPLDSVALITGAYIDAFELSGGWLRLYIGLATGNKTGADPNLLDAPDTIPFGSAVPAGDYTGTLIITTTGAEPVL